jgi:DNA-binding NtrC family response regulator
MSRVLIIDDSAEILALFGLALEEEGFVVDTAASGKAGLEQIRQATADVVVCDLFMPDDDGIATIMQLQREYPIVKIIAISGGGNYGLTNMLDVARKLGAAATLQKPFHPDQLVELVRAVLKET